MSVLAALLFAFAPLVTAPTHTLDEAATATVPAVRLDPPCDRDDVECVVRDVWPDNLEDRALRIAYRESRWQPHVRTWCCFGIMQIHKMHLAWLCPQLGICTTEALYDPRTNAEAGYALYLRDGWNPWRK